MGRPSGTRQWERCDSASWSLVIADKHVGLARLSCLQGYMVLLPDSRGPVRVEASHLWIEALT